MFQENVQLHGTHEKTEPHQYHDNHNEDDSQSTEIAEGQSSPKASRSSPHSLASAGQLLNKPKTKKRSHDLEDKALINRCAKIVEVPESQRDEVDVYTEYLGNEIRSLSAVDVLRFKKHVSDILYELKMASIINSSRTSIPAQQFANVHFVDSEGSPVILSGGTKTNNSSQMQENSLDDNLTLHDLTNLKKE